MGTAELNSLDLMLEVIRDHSPVSKWSGATLEPFRQVANTNRGDIGEDFIVRYLQLFDIPVAKSESRVYPWDLDIAGLKFEVKTASEDSGGSFQFNHIRLDRGYDYLLCLGVRPEEIVFNAWRKGEVSEGVAGTLVRMAEGQSVTHKLTKRPDTMKSIEDLPDWIRSVGTTP
jgi:hypothetical protein